MELIDKNAFDKMPGYTLFALYDKESGNLSEMVVKDPAYFPSDMALYPLTSNYKKLSEIEAALLKEKVENNPKKYSFKEPEEFTEFRDDQLFAIYEKFDIEMLAMRLNGIISLYNNNGN